MRRRPDQLHLTAATPSRARDRTAIGGSHMRWNRRRREKDRKLRTLRTIWAVVATLGVAAGATPAEGHAAQAALSCPATAQPGQQLTAEVRIDIAAPRALGAYSIMLTYDPTIVKIASAAGGTAREFSAAPALSTTDRGTTNISAFQSVSLTSPTGKVSVARITFDVVSTTRTTTSIGLTVNHLFDTDSMPILPATGAGCSVSVTGPTSISMSTPSAAAATAMRPRPARRAADGGNGGVRVAPADLQRGDLPRSRPTSPPAL